jgi:ABC-type transport system substrate-binding protein
MSLRTRRVMVLLAAFAIVASACGNAASPSVASAAPSSQGASAAPSSQGASAAPSPSSSAAASGDFRFVLDGEPTYFSPSSNDLPTSWVDALIYTALYRINNKGDIVPDMATAAPTISADGLTWTIKMRTDAKFQDGSPVTSADALFTYQIALSKKCSFNPTTCSTWFDNVTSVAAPDATTIVVVLKEKYAPFYLLGLASTLIVPKAFTEASYQKFVAGSAQADAAAVKKLSDQISTAQGDKGCAAATPPDTCNSSHYTADMEAALTTAGVKLPDKNRYLDAKGAVDPAAYGDAVLTLLTDLNTTLQAGETDKIAAAYRLLDLNLNPIGSGAYKFGNYQPGQSVELDRNDSYYLFTPGPAKVLIPIIKDAAAGSQALASNQIDWETEITSSDALASLKTNPAVKLSEYPDLGYYFMAFNVRPGHVFSDVIARQAFSMCIDQAATVKAATESNGTPVKAEVPPGSFFYNPDVPDYKLDVAGAKALLEKNGYTLSGGVYQKAGVKLSADLFVRSGRPQRVQFGQLAKDQLAKCGININVKEADFATVLLPLLDYPNKFDIYLGGWANLLDPEDSNIFGCKHATTKDNPSDNNFTGYCDPKVDDLMNQAKQESDRTKRKAILADLQLYLHTNGPYYFLWADIAHRGYSVNVNTNGVEGPIDYTTFYDFWNNDSWVVQK